MVEQSNPCPRPDETACRSEASSLHPKDQTKPEISTCSSLRNGSHLAAVTPTNFVLELSPDGDGGGKASAAEARQRPQMTAAASSGGGGLKRKRRSAKQQQQAALAAATSQGTLNL